jgi:hypothetical protein
MTEPIDAPSAGEREVGLKAAVTEPGGGRGLHVQVVGAVHAAGAPAAQVGQSVRVRMIGERPAVAGVQLHQHRFAHFPCQQAGFTSSEAARHCGHGRPYHVCPRTLGYRGLRGHLVLDRRHKRS